MLTSSRCTLIQGKTISKISEFVASLQYFRVSFWHPKTALKNTGSAHLRIPLECCGCTSLHWSSFSESVKQKLQLHILFLSFSAYVYPKQRPFKSLMIFLGN